MAPGKAADSDGAREGGRLGWRPGRQPTRMAPADSDGTRKGRLTWMAPGEAADSDGAREGGQLRWRPGRRPTRAWRQGRRPTRMAPRIPGRRPTQMARPTRMAPGKAADSDGAREGGRLGWRPGIWPTRMVDSDVGPVPRGTSGRARAQLVTLQLRPAQSGIGCTEERRARRHYLHLYKTISAQSLLRRHLPCRKPGEGGLRPAEGTRTGMEGGGSGTCKGCLGGGPATSGVPGSSVSRGRISRQALKRQ